MNIFSTRLQELMALRHVTQRQLAAMVDVTEAAMSRYVKGERMPRMNTVANIATALQTTSDYLLGRDTEHDAEFDFTTVKRLIARNASSMTADQKTELINALFATE